MTRGLGDAGAMVIVRRHDEIVRHALRTYGGRETKHTGDGIMASFVSASSAVKCALAMQQRFAEMDPQLSLQIRVGISAGEPVTERGDFFGTAVQLAARLCGAADPGTILVSQAVHELCAGTELNFGEVRELYFRGFPNSVRCYPVDLPRLDRSMPAGKP